ncbi:hypothetical protein [Stutzerimonas stutzeri]|uniref:hypothetical protein n=1 Tax=Stutzerimonas stutzeri TaxID=316 RepID=UPI00210CD43A|nr:hypothetical protein [Stutzerimonas stutzeri]MCQ4242294.1 hypothetical protein [Stutzerimonas stutzeri]
MKNLFAYLTNIMAWITEAPKTGKAKIRNDSTHYRKPHILLASAPHGSQQSGKSS